MFGLPALPPHEVGRFYAEVLLPKKPPVTLDAFTSYLETNYINAGCKFPPIWWAGHTDVTTTNACESFHQNLKHSSAHSHPDIWKLIATLEKEQTKTLLKMRAKNPLYAKPEVHKKKALKSQLREQYAAGTISQFTFVKLMAFKMLPASL